MLKEPELKVVHDPANTPPESYQHLPPFWNVPRLPSTHLMGTIGASSLENFYVVGEAWAHVVSRLAPAGARVMDIGCGCGRTARFLLLRSDLHYVGFDTFLPSIQWAASHVASLASSRFTFHHLDVRSAHYNPRGVIDPEQARFPAGDATIDLAFAASLFTHLRESAAAHYLAEVARCLRRGGRLVASIHDEVPAGEKCFGNEARMDVDAGHFMGLAARAGLRHEQALGAVCGQPTFVFEKP